MDYKNILVEQEEHLLIVTINRPEALNALSPETNREMEQVFNDFEKNSELWVAILTSIGDRAFSVGGDIKSMASASETGTEYMIPKTGYGGLTERFSCNKPIIAAVNGLALGGGFEIVLACDLAVAADHARFGLPEPLIGAVAYAGGMHRLPRQIGLKPAMELLLTSEQITAQNARTLGIINKVVPKDELMDTARKLAEKIMKGAPISIQATKQCATQGLNFSSLEDAMKSQTEKKYDMLDKMYGSHDVIEGITAFIEKRPPDWKGC